jgi:hypothetical protein
VSQTSVAAQDEMFFMRLRTHARWLFVLMAVVFFLSFVIAGVGSGSTGVGNMLQNFGSLFGGSGGSNPIKDAQKKVDKAGNDASKLAPALLALASAQGAKGNTSDAEKTYLRYLKLRPNDPAARYSLANQYKTAADGSESQLSPTLSDVVQSAPSSLGTGGMMTDPIAASVHQDAVSTASDLWKLYAADKGKELAALSAAVPLATGDLKNTALGLFASEAGTAANQALQFAQYVPEAPQAANAQQQALQWAVYLKAADEGVIKLHPHDSLTKQYEKQLKAVTAYLKSAGK